VLYAEVVGFSTYLEAAADVDEALSFLSEIFVMLDKMLHCFPTLKKVLLLFFFPFSFLFFSFLCFAFWWFSNFFFRIENSLWNSTI